LGRWDASFAPVARITKSPLRPLPRRRSLTRSFKRRARDALGRLGTPWDAFGTPRESKNPGKQPLGTFGTPQPARAARKRNSPLHLHLSTPIYSYLHLKTHAGRRWPVSPASPGITLRLIRRITPENADLSVKTALGRRITPSPRAKLFFRVATPGSSLPFRIHVGRRDALGTPLGRLKKAQSLGKHGVGTVGRLFYPLCAQNIFPSSRPQASIQSVQITPAKPSPRCGLVRITQDPPAKNPHQSAPKFNFPSPPPHPNLIERQKFISPRSVFHLDLSRPISTTNPGA
jgi:hypothetical protein